MLMWLDVYLTNRTGTVHFQGKNSKVNHLTNGTPQGSRLSPTLFNMVVNQLLQLNLGSKVQMIACANDLAIHGGPIREDILYKQMTTALKKIDTKAMQLIIIIIIIINVAYIHHVSENLILNQGCSQKYNYNENIHIHNYKIRNNCQ